MTTLAEAPLSLSALLGGHDRSHAAPPTDDDTGSAVPPAIAQAIVQAGQRMDARGWVPATAGNLSIRLDADRIAITRSGCHKGLLSAADIMLVDADGAALTDARPSAETLLHCQIYREDRRAGAVLHGHSVAATVLSQRAAAEIVLSDYEVLKAFAGVRTHQTSIRLPVFDNDQDIGCLAGVIAPHFSAGMPGGYLIRGHGVYSWGPDMPTALVRLEALEFLLACELERAKLR
jgi:methylthioribulose-1-phosphate dehydratase